jgi:dihydrofolate reductase
LKATTNSQNRGRLRTFTRASIASTPVARSQSAANAAKPAGQIADHAWKNEDEAEESEPVQGRDGAVRFDPVHRLARRLRRFVDYRLQNAIRTARTCRVRKGSGMARLVFGMNQSLDGYVDHTGFAPGPTLFRHFIEEAQAQAGSVYGRVMYEVMRYWDDDDPAWGAAEHAFAAAWRKQPKWVVSRSLTTVGPNATLVGNDLEKAIRELKAGRDGEIEVAGPDLARSLTELGLIDEYRIYLHPVVLGRGKPYFAGPRPPLRLIANDRMAEDVIRLTYVPA